jgi:DNA polymerase-3 subunit beta
MKIIISASQLLKNLQSLSGVINTNNTMPILDNFLFSFDKENLKVTASDLETTMSVSIKLDKSDFDKGHFCVPARLLIDILKTLPEQPLIIEFLEKNSMKLTSESGEYEIVYYNSEDFPKALVLENTSSTEIPSHVLLTAISKTINTTSTDELRAMLTGVLFQLTTTGLTFVSTDGNKLVKYSRTDLQSNENVNFIMPKKPLNVLKSVLAGVDQLVKIEYNNSNAVFTFDKYSLTCRLIDAKYPNYEGVIPKDSDKVLIIDRVSFAGAVGRVSICSNKETNQIKLKISGQEIIISSEDADYSNKGEERLNCDYQGEDLTIGFNSKFLSEMLKVANSDEVKIELSQPNRAGVITQNDSLEEGEEILILVMPTLLK